MAIRARFNRIASAVARAMGRPLAFTLALASILIWLVTGPVFRWSETWQLIVNTGTTIVTFLMVFLIQNSQNRDSTAIQTKLDEIVQSLKNSDNRVVGLEHKDEDEIERARSRSEQKAKIPAATN